MRSSLLSIPQEQNSVEGLSLLKSAKVLIIVGLMSKEMGRSTASRKDQA
jgi:hypothetical protein